MAQKIPYIDCCKRIYHLLETPHRNVILSIIIRMYPPHIHVGTIQLVV